MSNLIPLNKSSQSGKNYRAYYESPKDCPFKFKITDNYFAGDYAFIKDARRGWLFANTRSNEQMNAALGHRAAYVGKNMRPVLDTMYWRDIQVDNFRYLTGRAKGNTENDWQDACDQMDEDEQFDKIYNNEDFSLKNILEVDINEDCESIKLVTKKSKKLKQPEKQLNSPLKYIIKN